MFNRISVVVLVLCVGASGCAWFKSRQGQAIVSGGEQIACAVAEALDSSGTAATVCDVLPLVNNVVDQWVKEGRIVKTALQSRFKPEQLVDAKKASAFRKDGK